MILFILSGIGTGLSFLAFARIREAIQQQKRGKTLPLSEYLKVGLGLLRDDLNYWRLERESRQVVGNGLVKLKVVLRHCASALCSGYALFDSILSARSSAG